MSWNEPTSAMFLASTALTLFLLVWISVILAKRYREVKARFTLFLGLWTVAFLLHEGSEIVTAATRADAPSLGELGRNLVDLFTAGVMCYLISR